MRCKLVAEEESGVMPMLLGGDVLDLEKIRDELGKLKLSKQELAPLFELSVSALFHKMNGSRAWTGVELVKICHFTKLTPNDFFIAYEKRSNEDYD